MDLPKVEPWGPKEEKQEEELLNRLARMAVRPNGAMSKTGALIYSALTEICNPLLTPLVTGRGEFWKPYRDGEKSLPDFFALWLKYDPVPADPSKYIVFWGHLANTKSGLELANNNKRFKRWFVNFLNLRGRWLNSSCSDEAVAQWMEYKGTPEHPFDINDYEVPEGGFKSFNQFFLRNVKPEQRPLCESASDPNVVVAPCDGGIFYLTHGELTGNSYELPAKMDTFNLEEAMPGFGPAFVGGPLLDILLWFSDYHHFCAPVSGKVIHQGEFRGSYNYDFDDFDPDDPYAPSLPADSDRVGWYKSLGKHKRYVWIFRTENMGLVAMIAVGFWGVGSIINKVEPGQYLDKGDYMGHFGYGGSSIVLAFEPDKAMQFSVDGQRISDPDHPVLMKVKQCIGKCTSIWATGNPAAGSLADERRSG